LFSLTEGGFFLEQIDSSSNSITEEGSMSATTRRGFILFGALVVITAVFCIWLPFFALPKAGFGVGIPWITLPTDVLKGNVLPSFLGSDFTNSMTALIVVDVLLLLIGLTVRRSLAGWAPDRFVPRGLTNGIEMLVEFWYNTARNVLGEHTRRVVPLATTVFMFVIVGNLINLIPGFETVGVIACAEPGVVGYPLKGSGPFLDVSGASLKDRAGITAKKPDTEACEAKYNGTNGQPDYRAPKTIALEQRGELHAPGGDTGTKTGTATTGEGAGTTNGAASTGNPTNTGSGAGSTGGTANAQEAAGKTELFNVIPFFRGLATDLNMTLALAIIVFIAVQVWGIQSLGGAYFYKFINIPALGNLARKPMGVMDFVAGLVDIVSELSRLISLSFRLLGNVFAGSVLLAVMTFLVAGVLPVAFYGLELFAGAIQAYVFAILTVMYASQAVFAHHSDDEHDTEHEAAAAHAPSPAPQPVDVP